MKVCSALIFSALFCHAATAQIATISDPIELRNEDSYEIVGQVEGNLYVVQDRPQGAKLYCFDPSMKMKWENDLRCERKEFRVLGSVALPGHLGVAIQYRARGRHIVQFQKLDEHGTLVDSTTLVDYGKRAFAPKPFFISSHDRRKVGIFNDRTNHHLEALVFDTENMEIVWKEDLIANGLSIRNELYEVLLDNDGTMYPILYKDFGRAERHRNAFTVFQLDGNRKYSYRINMQGRLLYDARFVFDNANRFILGAGLSDSRKAGRADSYFMIRVSAGDLQESSMVFHEFEEGLLSTIRGKEANGNKHFSEAYVQGLVLKSDGGLLLLVERFKKVSQAYSHGAPMRPSAGGLGYSIPSEYHYDDVIALSMDGDGRADWGEVLYKRQFSRDDGGAFSSFFLMKTPTMLRFLYNDEIKPRDNQVSHYELSRIGEQRRRSILDTEGYGVNLMFKDGVQVGEGEIIIPSIRKRELKMVRIRYGAIY